jgi:uncharacterized protein (DUF433 family)
MNLPEFLTLHEYGGIRVTGHRIGLEHVIGRYREGFTPAMIHDYYPSLPLELIEKVIDFYETNRAETDAYVSECKKEYDRLERETPRGPSLEELKRRLTEIEARKPV